MAKKAKESISGTSFPIIQYHEEICTNHVEFKKGYATSNLQHLN